jgi:hypothetical protein
MAQQEERVKIIIENFVRGSNKVAEFREALEGLGTRVTRTGNLMDTATNKFMRQKEVINRFRQQYDSFSGVMKASMPVFRELVDSGVKLNSVGGRLALGFRRLAHGTHGFRMELLGVMFFGQMVQQTLMGLLQPAMDAYGIFELFSSMLLVLFLPIIDLLFPYFLRMIEFFMNLPQPIQLAIGALVVITAALAAIIGVVAGVALGLGSLVQFFALFGTGATTAAKAASGFKVALAAMSPALVIAGWVTGIVAFIAVLLMLEEKFGSFGAALKVWAAGVIMAIAIVVQGVADIIMSPLTLVLYTIKRVVDAYNAVAGFLGGKTIPTDWFTDAIKNMNTSIVTKTASFLDSAGWSQGQILADSKKGFNASSPAASLAPAQNPIAGMSAADQQRLAELDAMKQYGGMNNADLINMEMARRTGASAGNVNYSPTYNVQVLDKYELERSMNDHDRKLIDDVLRKIGVRGA